MRNAPRLTLPTRLAMLPRALQGTHMTLHRRLRLPTLLLALAFAAPVFAAKPLQPDQVKVNELVADLQKSSEDTDTLDLVWWIPEQFWAAVMAGEEDGDAETREQFGEVFRRNVVIAAVKGDIGTLGSTSFTSEAELRGQLRVLDPSGKPLAPIPADKVDPKLNLLLQIMRPMFKNVAGELGGNLQFYVFPAQVDGKPLADPLGQGRFTVMLGKTPYVFRLPLGSLLVPQRDPATGESFPGSYSFNPYTGAALSPESP